MDVTAATDAFIDHFINPHYLIDHEPGLLLLSKNEMPPNARQDDEYDDDDDDDEDFHHILFSEAGLSEADSVSLLSDAITTPLLQDHASGSAPIVSVFTEEIIPVQSSYPSNDGAGAGAVVQTGADGGGSTSSSALDFIYHLLFYDLDRLLLESYYPLSPPQRQTHQRASSITAKTPSPPAGNINSSKRRRDQPPPSPAPFDMDAVLRAQQEFIHKRQIEEAQAEQSGEKILASLPKRCRKRMASHPDGDPSTRV